MLRRYLIPTLCVLPFLAACGPDTAEDIAQGAPNTPSEADTALKADAVAYVNGTRISHELLTHEARRVTGRELSELDAETADKLLDAVIMRRALTLEARRGMQPDAERRLAAELEAYEEQVLVKRYLAERAVVQPVTDEMIDTYYENHKDRYESVQGREYEMLAVKPVESSRREVLQVLQAAKSHRDWAAAGTQIEALGATVTHAGGKVNTALLQPGLKKLLDDIQSPDESRLSRVEDTVYLVRITKAGETTHAPLSEVEASIRRELSAARVKQAIRELGGRVLKESDVERVDFPQDGSDAG